MCDITLRAPDSFAFSIIGEQIPDEKIGNMMLQKQLLFICLRPEVAVAGKRLHFSLRPKLRQKFFCIRIRIDRIRISMENQALCVQIPGTGRTVEKQSVSADGNNRSDPLLVKIRSR